LMLAHVHAFAGLQVQTKNMTRAVAAERDAPRPASRRSAGTASQRASV
jgi:hypothetical protein